MSAVDVPDTPVADMTRAQMRSILKAAGVKGAANMLRPQCEVMVAAMQGGTFEHVERVTARGVERRVVIRPWPEGAPTVEAEEAVRDAMTGRCIRVQRAWNQDGEEVEVYKVKGIDPDVVTILTPALHTRFIRIADIEEVFGTASAPIAARKGRGRGKAHPEPEDTDDDV